MILAAQWDGMARRYAGLVLPVLAKSHETFCTAFDQKAVSLFDMNVRL
jgi:hypothetical protein